MSNDEGFCETAAWELYTREMRADLQQTQDEFDKNFADERRGFCAGYSQGVSDASVPKHHLALSLHSYLNEESAAHRSAKLVDLKSMLRKMGFR